VKRVIVIDDDARTRRVLQILLERLGLESDAFDDGGAALELIRDQRVDLIVSDLKMPKMDGLTFMRELRKLDASVPVIMLTAYGTVESAVEAMKLGAIDYLSKPFDVEMLEALIQRSLEVSRRGIENRYFRELEERTPAFEDIVGDAPAMRRVFELIRKVAATRSAVLITGETGTGKELVARAIHRLSARKDELFVPLNCSAIPAELLESELFGHVRGAFSGAHSDRDGKFKAADGGTLFLDEIGDMDYGLQAKLLRVLQEGVIQPVGSNRQDAVDVRILSSTNRDLEAAIRNEKFREDLFYRLNVLRIELPSLSERRSDVPKLAHSFLRSFGAELGKGDLRFDSDAIEELCRRRWQGNVRELRNIVERAAVLADGAMIGGELIRSLFPTPEGRSDETASLDLASAVAAAERKAILRALAATGDNKVEAAAMLGIGERTLFTKLKRHGI
jgi:two-component system response regulator AtoC